MTGAFENFNEPRAVKELDDNNDENSLDDEVMSSFRACRFYWSMDSQLRKVEIVSRETYIMIRSIE